MFSMFAQILIPSMRAALLSLLCERQLHKDNFLELLGKRNWVVGVPDLALRTYF